MSVVPPDVSEVVDKQNEISSTELIVIVAPAAGLYPAAGTAFLVTVVCDKGERDGWCAWSILNGLDDEPRIATALRLAPPRPPPRNPNLS